MKVYYTLFLLAILVVTSWAQTDYMQEFKTTSKICQQEVQINIEELLKFFKNGMDPVDANDSIKCYLKCMMEKEGSFKNGEFSDQGFDQNIQKILLTKDKIDAAKKLGAKCKTEKGANDCDTVFKITMCFRDNMVEMGLPLK